KKEKKLKKEVEALQRPPEKPPSYLEAMPNEEEEEEVELGPVMTDEQKARLATKRPLTKEEYEARQSVIRRVVDPETGRTRLVRGEGEIIEEIVTREKHKEINKVNRMSSLLGEGHRLYSHLGLNGNGSSLVLPLRPQQLAVMLMLRCDAPGPWLWVRSSRSRSSRSLSDWLCVRSGLLWKLPVGELGAGWEEMVRSRWFLFLRKSLLAPRPKLPLRRTMRALLDLAGRERWLYSSWDKWAAYPSCFEEVGLVPERVVDQSVAEGDDAMWEVVLRQPGHHPLLLHVWTPRHVDDQIT
ncbi:hypothetical protein CCH79_00009115, partial [Gambusia affinis]